VAGAWLTCAATFGYLSAFGVYQAGYTLATDFSPSRISWIGSTQIFLMFFVGIISGKLLDLGRFKSTVLVGTILYSFSLFMLSLAHPQKYYQVFLSQGVGMGIGAGLLYTPAVAVQAHHWVKRRALAMGIVITGSAAGGIFFPIMLNQLVQGPSGFGWGVRYSAFVVLGMLIPANLLMSPNPVPKNADDPPPNIKGILTDVPYLVSCVATFFVFWGLLFPYFYLQIYSLLHGVDANLSFYTIAILNGSSIPARVLFNFSADKIGPFNAILPATLACGILNFALFGVTTKVSISIFAALYGFFSGAFLALCTPALASLSRSPAEIGIRVGFAMTFVSFGVLTGTPIDGALLGSKFVWRNAIIFSGIVITLGFAFMTLTRQLLVKQKGSARV